MPHGSVKSHSRPSSRPHSARDKSPGSVNGDGRISDDDIIDATEQKQKRVKRASPQIKRPASPYLNSPQNKPIQQKWAESVARGKGLTGEMRRGIFTGLTNPPKDMASASTPSYLRQVLNGEKPTAAGRNQEKMEKRPGTPAYKTPEEYYDEILEMKKAMAQLTSENSTLKNRLKRSEDEHAKKGKLIEELVDPSKGEDIRRALGNGRIDAGATINSLKQKSLRLEQQLKEKDRELNKLQSDLKTTKIEELRIHNETMFQEIQRLQRALQQSGESGRTRKEDGGSSARPKNAAQMLDNAKVLGDRVRRLTEENKRLNDENMALKKNYDKMSEDNAKLKEREKGIEHARYGKMTRSELIDKIVKLEQTIEELERSDRGRPHSARGKMTPRGNIEEKLVQLDKRESELLEENKKLKESLQRARDEAKESHAEADLKDKEITGLRSRLRELENELKELREMKNRGTPQRHQSPASPRSPRKRDDHDDKRPPTPAERYRAKSEEEDDKKRRERKPSIPVTPAPRKGSLGKGDDELADLLLSGVSRAYNNANYSDTDSITHSSTSLKSAGRSSTRGATPQKSPRGSSQASRRKPASDDDDDVAF